VNYTIVTSAQKLFSVSPITGYELDGVDAPVTQESRKYDYSHQREFGTIGNSYLWHICSFYIGIYEPNQKINNQ